MDIFIELALNPIDAFNWLTDEIFRFLNGLFDRYGLPVVFFAALLAIGINFLQVFQAHYTILHLASQNYQI